YVRDRFGARPTAQQREILRSVEPGAKVTCRSGHGTGKTTSAAWIVWWWLETSAYPRIPCTAPTSHQLRDVLWAELHKWVRKADEVSRRRGEPEVLWLSRLFSTLSDRIYDPAAPGEWFAVARTSKRENPDALQGFHASDMVISEDGQAVESHGEGGALLFVVDEASGVPDPVYEVAEGALSSPTATLLMLGNPVRRTGFFASSHLRDSGFQRIHLRSQDSPLVDPDFRQRLARRWGEDSNVVRVRADGEFPEQDDDVLIPYEIAEAALSREPHELLPRQHRALGVDVARFGSDRTVLTVRAGRNVERIAVMSQRDTMEVAGRAAEVAGGSRVDAIYVDVGAMGPGVADRLRELGWRVIDVSFGAAAPARGPLDEAQGRLMRDYLWLQAARWLRYEDPSFAQAARQDAQAAEDLVGELTETRYRIDSQGRLQIESKEEAARRGVQSPDIADSLITTFAPGGEGPRVASAGRRRAPVSTTRRGRP
ncbi:MAG: DEAD/DEAH box helicase family protein, partial [Pseudomonadota bacterium]